MEDVSCWDFEFLVGVKGIQFIIWEFKQEYYFEGDDCSGFVIFEIDVFIDCI